LEGASVDKNGITTVALDERILAESPGEKRVEFATDLPLSSGENSFMLLAKDVAGNQTRSPIKVFQGNPESAEARLWLLEQRHPELLVLASAGAPTSLPALLRSLELMAGAVDEEEGIRINLKSPAPDRPYRHNKTLRVSGTVISDGNVASLNINGEPYESLVGAPKEVFDKRIPLDDATLAAGTAQVDIAVNAGDTLGHANTLQFEVPVRPIFLESRESKMPVAVMPFMPHGEHLGGEDASLLRVETEGRIQEGKRFRVIDRTQLESVLTEQQLAALADPNEAIQLCKVVNAQAFIVADVFEYGSSGMEVKARAISAETTDVVATLDVFVADRNDRGAISQACDDLAQQLARTFPRLSGELVAVKDAGAGQEMLVNWTAEDGIREGMYLIVVHEEVWGDEDDEFAERELVEVGKARIERVLKNSSKAVTVTTEGDVKLEEGMAAVTM